MPKEIAFKVATFRIRVRFHAERNMELLRQLFSPNEWKAKIWVVVLILLLGVKVFILLDGGAEARDAVSDRLRLTELQIEESGQAFQDQKDRDHKVFRSIRLREFVASGIWYGAAIGVCVVGLLLSTFKWWTRTIPPKPANIRYPSKRTLAWIVAIAVVGLFIRLPRMDFSLYNDEAFNFTRYIHGQFKWNEETGQNEFRKASWQQTAWGNHFGNNGKLYSIMARVSHDAWQKSTGAVDSEVSEFALRVPSLVAGVASIVAIGILGSICLCARTGLIAAILTALHPWHLRYSTEARSYGMVLFFAAIILLSLVLAVREGRWRWWILFSVTQVLCLWSYIGTVYFLLAVNLVVLFWIITRHRTVFPRWLVLNALGAAIFVQITAPSLPQILYAGANMGSLQGWTNLDGATEIVSYLISGMPLKDMSPENPNSPAWLDFGPAGFVIFCLFVAFSLFALVCIVKKKQAAAAFITFASVGSVILAISISNTTKSVVHHWYIIYALPGVILLMAAAVGFLWNSRFKLAGPLLLALFIAGFAKPAVSYLKQGKEQLRDVMMFIRGDVYPFDEESGHPLVAAFWSDIIYDPTIIYTPSIDTLKEAIERSKAENRPLFVEFGFRPLAMQHNADLVEFIENSGRFKHLKTFHGLEETQFTHHVFKLVK